MWVRVRPLASTLHASLSEVIPMRRRLVAIVPCVLALACAPLVVGCAPDEEEEESLMTFLSNLDQGALVGDRTEEPTDYHRPREAEAR